VSNLAEFEDLAFQSEELVEQEQTVVRRLQDAGYDFEAMALASNVFRAATAMRRNLEQRVLADAALSWTAFKVLWVLWIWGERETSFLAVEADITKGTLTGVVDTLERRGLVTRQRRQDDRRLVQVGLTDDGRELIGQLFPVFNAEERAMADLVTDSDQRALVRGLRRLVAALPGHRDEDA
jgi:DNA-binding MarR family transcriptional regulator